MFLSFLGTLLACPALAIWSSVRGWNAGAACVALGVTGGPLTLISGAAGTAWIFYRVDEGTADELEKARDEYDRELQQVVHNA
ncbi:hypothetical protein [Tsukamurella pulmonis]|uniref:hypothetical protein n=1 Tax=Tsukamurella pulmonis TaxID=47312 RepID=UPI001EDDE95A|nr:hypothetical protein [Tsukamurella pulmonis]